MIGYKVAKAGDTRVIVTLEIPHDALTNTNRKDIVNPITAKYRTNKARVLKIEDESGKEYDEATSFCHVDPKMTYTQPKMKYTVNKEVIVENYDRNIDVVCGPGIHFFLSRRVAKLYNLHNLENGIFEEWHENGNISKTCTCVNGKKEGLFQAWYYNGKKQLEYTYVNGVPEGLYQEWYMSGKKWVECRYVDGKKEGLYRTWYANGNIHEECTYVNGKRV